MPGDRLDGAEVCTAVDGSCLLQIGGRLSRERAGVRTMHLAEILAAQEPVMTRPFPEAAHEALADRQLRTNMRNATATIRDKRARVVAELPDWEELREAGRAIKADVLANLDRYLVQFEEAVIAAGGHVHWARDAAEANAHVLAIARTTASREVVKVKSLTTDEIGLNDALAAGGVQAIETDFAELILQLDGDWSSHILVPAIHRNRTEIRDLFRAHDRRRLDLRRSARARRGRRAVYLREKFLNARMGVSGANFGIAETGTVCVVESEGNGRMCTTLPPVLVTILGIEKLVPTFADLEVFLQLLPRSSTGERMNPYTSLWTGVTAGDGPQEFHVVLLDAGRTRVLADEVGRAGAALHPLQRVPQRVPCLLAHRRPRLRLGLSRADRGDPDAAADRDREGAVAAVCLEPLRRLLRGLPGEDRHPDRALASALRGRAGGGRPRRAAADGGGRLDLPRAPPLRACPAARTARQRPFVRGARSAACPRRSPAGRGRETCGPSPGRASATGGGERQ